MCLGFCRDIKQRVNRWMNQVRGEWPDIWIIRWISRILKRYIYQQFVINLEKRRFQNRKRNRKNSKDRQIFCKWREKASERVSEWVNMWLSESMSECVNGWLANWMIEWFSAVWESMVCTCNHLVFTSLGIFVWVYLCPCVYICLWSPRKRPRSRGICIFTSTHLHTRFYIMYTLLPAQEMVVRIFTTGYLHKHCGRHSILSIILFTIKFHILYYMQQSLSSYETHIWKLLTVKYHY